MERKHLAILGAVGAVAGVALSYGGLMVAAMPYGGSPMTLIDVSKGPARTQDKKAIIPDHITFPYILVDGQSSPPFIHAFNSDSELTVFHPQYSPIQYFPDEPEQGWIGVQMPKEEVVERHDDMIEVIHTYREIWQNIFDPDHFAENELYFYPEEEFYMYLNEEGFWKRLYFPRVYNGEEIWISKKFSSPNTLPNPYVIEPKDTATWVTLKFPEPKVLKTKEEIMAALDRIEAQHRAIINSATLTWDDENAVDASLPVQSSLNDWAGDSTPRQIAYHLGITTAGAALGILGALGIARMWQRS